MLCLLKIYVKINLAEEVFQKSIKLPKFKQLFLLSNDGRLNNLNDLVLTGISQQSKTLQAWSNFTKEFFTYFTDVWVLLSLSLLLYPLFPLLLSLLFIFFLSKLRRDPRKVMLINPNSLKLILQFRDYIWKCSLFALKPLPSDMATRPECSDDHLCTTNCWQFLPGLASCHFSMHTCPPEQLTTAKPVLPQGEGQVS